LVEKVKFDGRTRVIRACKENWFKKETDSGNNRSLDPEITVPDSGNNRSPTIIYSKEESKDKICIGNAQVREKKPEVKMNQFGKFVKLSDEDYKKFIKEHGAKEAHEIIESINDYCTNHKTGGYKDYAAAFRTFAKRDRRKTNESRDSKSNNRGRSPSSSSGDKPSVKQGIYIDGVLRTS